MFAQTTFHAILDPPYPAGLDDVVYTWSFGDGSVFQTNTSSTNYTFTASRNYNVQVNATNPRSAAASVLSAASCYQAMG